MKLIFGVIGSFVAVAGFAVLLETPRRYLLHAGIAGAIGGFVYLFSIQRGGGCGPVLIFFCAGDCAYIAYLCTGV